MNAPSPSTRHEIRKRWIVAIGYVLMIYLTLGWVRTPTAYLRERGILRLTLLSIYGVSFLGIGTILARRISWKKGWRGVVYVLVFSSYFWIAQFANSPEEQIHFLEYGLVGVFFIRALRLHSSSKWKPAVAAFILGSLTGIVDELIQGILPNRFYDNWDIFLNVIAVILGLIVYHIFPPKRPVPSDE